MKDESDLARLGDWLERRERWQGAEGERPRAAVLIPLYGPGPDFRVLYTVRTQEVEHHKGEISFPGGGVEPADESLEQTALRETHEEVGIAPADVTLLGRLDDVITISDFLVTPVVGRVEVYPYTFAPARLEVAEVLEVPLSHLRDPANRAAHPNPPKGRSRAKFPAYRFGEHLIFGATALMTTRLLRALAEA